MWNLCLRSRKLVKANCLARSERTLCEAARVKPGLLWRAQYVGDDRAMGYLSRRAVGSVWNKSRVEMCVAVNNAGRSRRYENSLKPWTLDR